MSNITNYINYFFNKLEIWEDLNKKQNHKELMLEATLNFLDNHNIENAFRVYEAFFSAYWIGTPGDENPFVKLTQKMKSFEENAGLLLPKQRDHFIHSVYVFILGLAIFSQNNNYQITFNKAVLAKLVYKDSYDTKNEEFLYRWGISSLFHDIAYPLEITIKQINVYIDFISNHNEIPSSNLKVRMTIDNINDFNNLPQILPLAEFSSEYKSKYPLCEKLNLSDSIDLLSHKINASFGLDIDKVKTGLTEFAFKMQEEHFIDHGYYSALIVLRWYYYLIQKSAWNPAYFYYPIVDSASAILLHNYYRHGLMKSPFDLNKMNVESHPIAFLLILCDELQDWNRTAFGELDRNMSLPTGFNIFISDDTLELTYQIDGGGVGIEYVDKKEKAISSILKLDNLFTNGIKLST